MRDSELELLLDTVHDEPGHAAYLTVARALVQRNRMAEAARVLERGLTQRVEPGARELHARVLLDLGRPEEILAIIRAPMVGELEQLRILALEQAGRTEEARSAALDLLLRDSRDPFPKEVLKRLATPLPRPELRGADPFLTAQCAERYAAHGHADRAIRVYRRILLANPEESAIQYRIDELRRLAPREPPRKELRSSDLGAASAPLPAGFGVPDPRSRGMTVPSLADNAVEFEAIGFDRDDDEVTLVESRPQLTEVVPTRLSSTPPGPKSRPPRS